MSQWIALDGAVNVRDVGGISTTSGAKVRRGRLLRSDNLTELSERDVKTLVEHIGVRTISDLRTGHEVRAEGIGPLAAVADVLVQHNSLFNEAGENTDAGAAEDSFTQRVAAGAASAAAQDDGDVVLLPWQDPAQERDYASLGAVEVYSRYLLDRPDSVLATLRLIGHADGATLVHCAAGKDRTGVVVAMALAGVGAERDEIAADFALTAERIHLIFQRLRRSPTYARDVQEGSEDLHTPQAGTLLALLDRLDAHYGGVLGWLAEHGWSSADQRALEISLLG